MENNKKTNKKFSIEFKQEAVSRSHIVGIMQTCEELGIAKSTIKRWRSEFSDVGSNYSKSTKPSYEELEKENRKLKKEMAYIEEINRILKKSTAIFSSSQMVNLKSFT